MTDADWIAALAAAVGATPPVRPEDLASLLGDLEDPTGWGEQLRATAPVVTVAREASVLLAPDGTVRLAVAQLSEDAGLDASSLEQRFGVARAVPASGERPQVTYAAAPGCTLIATLEVDGRVAELWFRRDVS